MKRLLQATHKIGHVERSIAQHRIFGASYVMTEDEITFTRNRLAFTDEHSFTYKVPHNLVKVIEWMSADDVVISFNRSIRNDTYKIYEGNNFDCDILIEGEDVLIRHRELDEWFVTTVDVINWMGMATVTKAHILYEGEV